LHFPVAKYPDQQKWSVTVFATPYLPTLSVFTSALAQQAMQALQAMQATTEGMSVCQSVCHTPVLYQNEESGVMISSPSESLNILVSRNIWPITKFERGHPERGRFTRLEWVKYIANFEDFSTNKPLYLRNGAI